MLLSDQFESKNTTLFSPRSFCNPASLDFERVSDPTAHLTCYQIKDVPGQDSFTPRDVVARKVGSPLDETLTVRKPSLLYVPSEKNGVASQLNINHFKCYTARSRSKASGGVDVVVDEFGGGIVKRRRIDTFCNPVDKNGEGINDPTNHLVCAKISGRKAVGQDAVVQNQFGEQMLTAVKLKRICLASLKCDPLPAVCEGQCGDGSVNAACCEQCDPPFSAGGEVGCSDTCQQECGNHVLDPTLGEECDGNDDAACPWRCRSDCTCAPLGSPSGAFLDVASTALD